MTRHINACKISIILSSCQLFQLIVIWEDNTANCPDLLLNNNEENIYLEIWNDSEKKIKLADIIDNNNEDIKSVDIN